MNDRKNSCNTLMHKKMVGQIRPYKAFCIYFDSVM